MKQEINLDNPIFVYYLNVNNMSHYDIEEYVDKINKVWSFQNVITWIVPRREGETKIECVYDGRIKERGEELKELIEEINDKIEILSESGNFDDFKIAIREWRLSNILK
jgi:hypothetical protein